MFGSSRGWLWAQRLLCLFCLDSIRRAPHPSKLSKGLRPLTLFHAFLRVFAFFCGCVFYMFLCIQWHTSKLAIALHAQVKTSDYYHYFMVTILEQRCDYGGWCRTFLLLLPGAFFPSKLFFCFPPIMNLFVVCPTGILLFIYLRDSSSFANFL